MHRIARISTIGLVAAACAATSIAGAGQYYLEEVQIFRGGTFNYFQGSLAGARFSRDSNQNLGCFTYASPGKTQGAICYAKDANGIEVSCGTTDWNLVEVAGRANASSELIVQFDQNATCNYISVDANSREVF
jgi:hypothetical protein